MIYSSEFVWLHFPKCAGTKIERIFKEYYTNNPNIHQDPVTFIEDPKVKWHDSIFQRQQRDKKFVLGDRDVICSFRRLPAWLESRYNFEYYRSPHIKHNPERLLKGYILNANGVERHADQIARKYLPDKILQKVIFIRTEFFEQDFKKVFSKYLDLSIIPDSEFASIVNKSKPALEEHIRGKLYNDNRVYSECPYWTFIENLAYK